MKNKNKHQSLERSEFRDYLGRELRGCGVINRGDPQTVRLLKDKIAKLQEQLKREQDALLIRQIIANNEWEVVDVSDKVEDYDSSYFPFIGTEEEASNKFS